MAVKAGWDCRPPVLSRRPRGRFKLGQALRKQQSIPADQLNRFWCSLMSTNAFPRSATCEWLLISSWPIVLLCTGRKTTASGVFARELWIAHRWNRHRPTYGTAACYPRHYVARLEPTRRTAVQRQDVPSPSGRQPSRQPDARGNTLRER